MTDDIIPPTPWGIQVSEKFLLIGSVSPEEPERVDEIVCRVDYEQGVVNREIELARAQFIVAAVNSYAAGNRLTKRRKPNITDGPNPSLRGSDSKRASLPNATGARQTPLSNAWRGSRKRCSYWQQERPSPWPLYRGSQS
jgi:hypothetical protein